MEIVRYWPLCRASRFHQVATAVWIVLAVPTVTVWKDAIWWIGLISVYANIVSHMGAAEAAKAKEKQEP